MDKKYFNADQSIYENIVSISHHFFKLKKNVADKNYGIGNPVLQSKRLEEYIQKISACLNKNELVKLDKKDQCKKFLELLSYISDMQDVKSRNNMISMLIGLALLPRSWVRDLIDQLHEECQELPESHKGKVILLGQEVDESMVQTIYPVIKDVKHKLDEIDIARTYRFAP